MEKEDKLIVAKELIEEGKIKTFKDIFFYITRTEITKPLGFNYKVFRGKINNPANFKYSETVRIAHLLKVPALAISTLIHNQLEAKKPTKAKKV